MAATTMPTVWQDFFDDMVTALEGNDAGEFIKVHEGIKDPSSVERPFFAIELLEMENPVASGQEDVKRLKVKLRIAFVATTNNSGREALTQIGYVEDALDNYTPPAGSFGFKERVWSFTWPRADVPAMLVFCDCLTEIEVKVTRGSN